MFKGSTGSDSRRLFSFKFKDCLPNGFNDLLLAALDNLGAWLERRKTSTTNYRNKQAGTPRVRGKRAATIYSS